MESFDTIQNGFLINQLFLNRSAVIDALDGQAAAIKETREQVLDRLQKVVPEFVGMVRG
jgi:hypothetical protein